MTIIQLSARRSEARNEIVLSHFVAETFRVSQNGAAFIDAMDAAMEDRQKALHQVAASALSAALGTPDLLSSLRWPQGVREAPTRLPLAETRYYRIFACRWRRGQFGPLLRMMDWFAYGVAQGDLVQLEYSDSERPDARTGWGAVRSVAGQTALATGQLRHGDSDAASLRRFANMSNAFAISLHVEGLAQPATAAEPVHMQVPWVDARIARRPRLGLVRGGAEDVG